MYMTYLMPTLGKLLERKFYIFNTPLYPFTRIQTVLKLWLAENIILLNGFKAGAKMTPYKNFVGVMDIFLEYL